MENAKPKRSSGKSKARPAARVDSALLKSGNAAALPPDTRRVIPTQDWIAKVDKAQLDAVLNVQKLAVTHFYNGLLGLRNDFAKQIILPPPQTTLPNDLSGVLCLPDGSIGSGLAVSILSVTDANGQNITLAQMSITDRLGQFKLSNLPSLPVNDKSTIVLLFRGSNGSESRTFSPTQIGALGILGYISLRLALQPLPLSIVGSLRDIVGGLDAALPQPARPGTVENPIQVKLGEDSCPITFDHNLPEERYRYSVLYRLVEPRASILTETFTIRNADGFAGFAFAARNRQWQAIVDLEPSFAERVPVDQPISVDGFRDRIVGNVNGVISDEETVPMAGTLGLGYMVHMSQQWSPSGLSLGDLLYSLPLAPGEQQRIAVFEQRQSLTTTELESLDFEEQQRASQQSDASTSAVFNSAFTEAVRGSSSFTTNADSSSWGVAGGLGLALGPVVLGVGGGGGGGSSSSSGSSSNSLDGARTYTSNAASQAHSAVEREAEARRHAQRTGIRLATASDTEQVTTKVITNNNRIHALTMQYWEVLRHFDITSAVDGVTLVCFVPLEVVRFLPPNVSAALVETEIQTRDQILYRYKQILKHADILKKWIPVQYRQGLAILEEFASNPRAVPSFNGPTEDIVHVELTGSFLPFEDVYVQVLTRRGTRLGPIRMSGTIPPLPDKVTDAAHAFSTQADLMAELVRRRGPDQNITLSANISLPSSLNPDEVIGFELSRNFRPLRYQLVPPKDDPLQKLIGDGNLNSLGVWGPFFAGTIQVQVEGVNLDPDALEAELGGPSIWGFKAATTGSPVETYASSFISAAERLQMPQNGYPIAAQPVNPLLKFNQLLKIEQTLQYVVRNTITYSRAVWMSVTPEERAIMLEGFTIGVPTGGITDPSQNVPLLNCIANQVLGFYGNAMIMPFNIPAAVSTLLSLDGQDNQQRPFTTAEVQNALTQFHRVAFSAPVSHIALPTHGVLGEAILGSCPSAEKIDLTRFWNWQDSPIPQAADIAGNLLNKGSSLIGATAPSTLTNLPSIVQNVNAPPADANAALQALIAGQNTKDLPNITGMDQLATLQGKTIDTAEKARADALARAQSLASDGLNKASDIMKAKIEAEKVNQQAKQQQDAKAQQDSKSQQQQAINNMRTNASSYLAVANARPSQDAANAYAKQIIDSIFGGQSPSLDVASTLFSNYQKFQSGNSGPLTQGSTAFLTALGLM